jgi:hypothetical protein
MTTTSFAHCGGGDTHFMKDTTRDQGHPRFTLVTFPNVIESRFRYRGFSIKVKDGYNDVSHRLEDHPKQRDGFRRIPPPSAPN